MQTTLHSSSILAESQDNNFTRVILCMVRRYIDSNMATDPLAKCFLVASMTKATGAQERTGGSPLLYKEKGEWNR
jgi:hypothetical protein